MYCNKCNSSIQTIPYGFKKGDPFYYIVCDCKGNKITDVLTPTKDLVSCETHSPGHDCILEITATCGKEPCKIKLNQ